VKYKILSAFSVGLALVRYYNQAYHDVREAFGVPWENFDMRVGRTSAFGGAQEPEITSQRYDELINNPAYADWGVIGDIYFPSYDQWKDLSKTGRPLWLGSELPLPYDEFPLSKIA